jgi:hypothetical protein
MSRGPPGRWRWVHRRMHDAQPVGTRIPGQPLERGPGGLRQILPPATPTLPPAMTARVIMTLSAVMVRSRCRGSGAGTAMRASGGLGEPTEVDGRFFYESGSLR